MDQRLFLLINREWIHPLLDKPMAAFSSWDLWWPIMAAIVIVILVFGNFHVRAAVVCAGLSVGITDGIVVDTIKNFVGRPRPNQVMEGVRMVDLARARPRVLALGKPVRIEYSQPSIGPIRGISFPSGHASNNFAIATVLVVFFRRWGWLYLVPAMLVSYSRMYVGSHYPLDTLVAILVGIGVALIVVAVCEWVWTTRGRGIAPKLWERHPSLVRG